MAELKSTLRVFNEADLETSKSGVVVKGSEGRKVLVGNQERPSERLRVHIRSFKPGAHTPLHWHVIEAVYYVISGSAVLEDIEGNTYDIGPGTVIYYPAGIAGSHGWDVKEEMKLISIRATTDREKNIQFNVDRETKESTIALDYLLRRGGAKFKSFY